MSKDHSGVSPATGKGCSPKLRGGLASRPRDKAKLLPPLPRAELCVHGTGRGGLFSVYFTVETQLPGVISSKSVGTRPTHSIASIKTMS